jgi:DNA polymerase
MIGAMGYAREQVYICNVVKCRPPGNRNPEPDEIAACEPFLIQQLGAIRPRMIVALGKFAAQTLLRSDSPISALRGRFHRYQGIALMPTFHPAYLLRNPSSKREVWADLQLVMSELDRLGVARGKPIAG